MTKPELIYWHDAETDKPDAATTVICWGRDGPDSNAALLAYCSQMHLDLDEKTVVFSQA